MKDKLINGGTFYDNIKGSMKVNETFSSFFTHDEKAGSIHITEMLCRKQYRYSTKRICSCSCTAVATQLPDHPCR